MNDSQQSAHDDLRQSHDTQSHGTGPGRDRPAMADRGIQKLDNLPVGHGELLGITGTSHPAIIPKLQIEGPKPAAEADYLQGYVPSPGSKSQSKAGNRKKIKSKRSSIIMKFNNTDGMDLNDQKMQSGVTISVKGWDNVKKSPRELIDVNNTSICSLHKSPRSNQSNKRDCHSFIKKVTQELVADDQNSKDKVPGELLCGPSNRRPEEESPLSENQSQSLAPIHPAAAAGRGSVPIPLGRPTINPLDAKWTETSNHQPNLQNTQSAASKIIDPKFSSVDKGGINHQNISFGGQNESSRGGMDDNRKVDQSTQGQSHLSSRTKRILTPEKGFSAKVPLAMGKLDINSLSPAVMEYLKQAQTQRHDQSLGGNDPMRIIEIDEQYIRDQLFKQKKESVRRQMMRGHMNQKIQQSKTIDHNNMRQTIRHNQNMCNFIELTRHQLLSSRNSSPSARISGKANSVYLKQQASKESTRKKTQIHSINVTQGSIRNSTIQSSKSPSSPCSRGNQLRPNYVGTSFQDQSGVEEQLIQSLLVPLKIKKLNDKFPQKKFPVKVGKPRPKQQKLQVKFQNFDLLSRSQAPELFPPTQVLSDRTQKQMSRVRQAATNTKEGFSPQLEQFEEDFRNYCSFHDDKKLAGFHDSLQSGEDGDSGPRVKEAATRPKVLVEAKAKVCTKYLKQHVWPKCQRQNAETSPDYMYDGKSIQANLTQMIENQASNDQLNTTYRMSEQRVVPNRHSSNNKRQYDQSGYTKANNSSLLQSKADQPIPGQSPSSGVRVSKGGSFTVPPHALGPPQKNLDIRLSQAERELKIMQRASPVVETMHGSPGPTDIHLQKLDTLALEQTGDLTNDSKTQKLTRVRLDSFQDSFHIDQNKSKLVVQHSVDCGSILEEEVSDQL